jgi:hypothetical protein
MRIVADLVKGVLKATMLQQEICEAQQIGLVVAIKAKKFDLAGSIPLLSSRSR